MNLRFCGGGINPGVRPCADAQRPPSVDLYWSVSGWFPVGGWGDRTQRKSDPVWPVRIRLPSSGFLFMNIAYLLYWVMLRRGRTLPYYTPVRGFGKGMRTDIFPLAQGHTLLVWEFQ